MGSPPKPFRTAQVIDGPVMYYNACTLSLYGEKFCWGQRKHKTTMASWFCASPLL